MTENLRLDRSGEGFAVQTVAGSSSFINLTYSPYQRLARGKMSIASECRPLVLLA